MKKIAVVGGLGNMGSRYCAILRMLKIDYAILDAKVPWDSEEDLKVDGIIIATPTEWHVEDILEFSDVGVPILCEKPITTDLKLLEKALHVSVPLRMINQYEYFMQNWNGSGKTYYDYFKTGGDTLKWDCINITGLAKSDCEIQNNSPFWECWLNGRKLSLDLMDHAYVWNIESWLKGCRDNRDYIRHAHKKVLEMVHD